MSAAGLLGPGGKIQPIYLPSGPAPAHPYVENPFQENVDGGGFSLSGVNYLDITGALVVNSGAGAIVTVNANGGPGNGLVVRPADQTAGNGTINLLNGSASINPSEYVFYNSSASGGGLTAGHLSLYAYAAGNDALILDAAPNGSVVLVGDGSVAGGCSLEVNGASGVSRVFDPVYNPVVVITPVVAGGTGNLVTDTTIPDLAEGTYQLQLTAETITPTAFSFLRLFAYPPPATTVINFSCNALGAPAADSSVLGLNSGFFEHAGGDLRVIVQSSAANWTANEWNLQLVRYK
jgi:hypothetical protein